MFGPEPNTAHGAGWGLLSHFGNLEKHEDIGKLYTPRHKRNLDRRIGCKMDGNVPAMRVRWPK